jgi:endonuclease/exonuclease/phosphatase family metal-dependent hydrolase
LKFLKKSWFPIILLVVSLLCYGSVYISPVSFWPAVFLSLTTPLFIILNFLLIIFYIVKRNRLIVWPLLGFLSASPFMNRTISFDGSSPDKETLSVLSFNSKFFRKAKTYEAFSLDMIQWTVNHPGDIKCLQEYSTNSRWPELDVTAQMERRGYHAFTFSSKMKKNNHNNGMAIFSKYPILKSEVIQQDTTSANAVLYADIKIEKDTLRIYNAHFESMNLQLHRFKTPDNTIGNFRELISKLKKGSINRSIKINSLIEHTQNSPYPFIICGDFNETPYSYIYQQLQALFTNSFEAAGNGFGFTLNSPLFFLRIDHHFYGKGITAKNFKVDRTMSISDHFPTLGDYRIEK